MFEVMEISLKLTFPSDWIKMVAMQPHIHLTDTKPSFKWPDSEKEKQIAGIKRTLEIAMEQQAHFTLFPEYSIPGLKGIRVINDVIANSDWPNGTIIMGGIDGLSKEEYQQLCTLPNTNCHPNSGPDYVGKTEWVNCSVTWVKDNHGNHGNITKYVQPKISPAKDESLTPLKSFFRGSVVNFYKGTFSRPDSTFYEFSFFSLICFDWIDQSSGCRINERVLQHLNTTQRTLEWIFLLQHNLKPNHPPFLDSTRHFFNNSICNNVIRHDSVVIFANTASDDKPTSYSPNNFACSSVVFHPSANVLSDERISRPTICSKRGKYRNLDTCHDIVFREMGACIHSFKIHIPRFSPLDSSGRCLPIEQAYVHPINDGAYDPRLPGGEVPACTKWVNDNLDDTIPLNNHIHINHLSVEAENSHAIVVNHIRQLSADKHELNIHYASAFHLPKLEGDIWRNVDNWNQEEENALKHMLYTLAMINIAYTTDLQNNELHATIIVNDKPVEVITIRGATHDDCFTYFKEYVPIAISRKIFLITQDDNSSIITQGQVKKFAEIPSSEYKITQPGSCYRIKDYQTIQQAIQLKDSTDDFKEEIARYVA